MTLINITSNEKTNYFYYETLSTTELINEIYVFCEKCFNICKESNSRLNIKLNCIAEYSNTGYALDKNNRQIMIYSNSVIKKYADEPTLKDCSIIKWIRYLINAGYSSESYNIYIDKFYNKYEKYELYRKLYAQLYELGLILEILYLLSNAINIAKKSPINLEIDISIRKLCNQIQEYIYDERDYDKIEQEMEMFNSITLENSDLKYKQTNLISENQQLEYENDDLKYVNMKYNEFLYFIKLDLESNYSLSELFELRENRINKILNWGIDSETTHLFNTINKYILEQIQKQIEIESQYLNQKKLIHKFLSNYKEKIIKRLKYYLGNELYLNLNFEANFEVIENSLSTAEYLYTLFVEPYKNMSIEDYPEEAKSMDYSCIALEYYTALETAANLLLYKPYRIKILEPQYQKFLINQQNSNIDNNSRSKEEMFKMAMRGYVGKLSSNVIVDYKNRMMKQNLEIGNLASMYKDMLFRNNEISNKYIQIGNYLSDIKANKVKVRDIGKYLFSMKNLRNDAAHGGNRLDINKARKAQDVVYKHKPLSDQSIIISETDECHKLLILIMELFQ